MDIRRELLIAVRKHGSFSDADLLAIYEQGAGVGWPGFSDHIETWSFYHKHHELIWALLREYATSEGRTPLEVLATLDGADMIDDGPKLKRLLAEFALSEAVSFFLAEQSDAAQA